MSIFSLFERAGYYDEHYKESDYSHKYWTFNPKPLNEVDFLKLDDEMALWLARANRAIGLLEGTCSGIKEIVNVNRILLAREAIASCRIDNEIKCTLHEVIAAGKQLQRKIIVQCCLSAHEYALSEMERIHLSNKMLNSIHGLLIDYKKDKEIVGDVRRKQNAINTLFYSNSIAPLYNPPVPEALSHCMIDLQEYYRKNSNYDLLLRAALLHYQMEVIHPYESGNGKLGRLLVHMYLREQKILTKVLLPFSEILLERKVEYFDRIAEVHNRGNYEQWIKFFLEVLTLSAEQILAQINDILLMRDQDIAAIHKLKSKDEKYLLDAYTFLEELLFVDTGLIAKKIGVSYNTASRVVAQLVNLNIVQLKNNQKRNRIFIHTSFLKNLDVNLSEQPLP